MYKGESKRIKIYITDESGLPLNLTDTEIIFVLYNQTTKVIRVTKTLGSGISISDTELGVIIITLDGTDTVNLLEAVLNHECRVTDITGPSVVEVGIVTLIKSMTN
jgi:hypothetical protein